MKPRRLREQLAPDVVVVCEFAEPGPEADAAKLRALRRLLALAPKSVEAVVPARRGGR
jgi:hypothetical protein